MTSKATTSKTYGERVASHSNQAAKDLLLTMERKKTNLCVSVDVTSKEELLKIVEAVGESCCCIKVRSCPTSEREVGAKEGGKEERLSSTLSFSSFVLPPCPYPSSLLRDSLID